MQVNIYQNPDTRCSLFAPPPFCLSHFFLMCGQKQTELEPNAGRAPREGTQRSSIYGAASSLFTSCRSSTSCATVSPSRRLHWPQTWHVWPCLSSSSSVSLYLSSAPDVHPAPGRPCRHVSLEVQALDLCFLIALLFI